MKTKIKKALATAILLAPTISQASSSTNPAEAPSKNAISYTPGERVKTGELPAGYNASASYQCLKGWDIFITADYIYWNWQQESLEISTLLAVSGRGTRETFFQTPGYASGFQVGIGFNLPYMDDWNLYSEYTWYRNSDSTSLSNGLGQALQPSQGGAFFLDGTITSEIKMYFDTLNLLVKRPFYFGKKLTANFAMGLKVLWITQNFNGSYNGSLGSSIKNLDRLITGAYTQRQTSWGLGPNFSLETNWLLGYGLQIMANLSASALYTRYNVNGQDSNVSNGNSLGGGKSIALDSYNTLRPITEMFLGLGWGTGFNKNSYHVQLSAGYDFNVFWMYNMRDYAIDKIVGNMYLQGLNVAARFDF